MIHSTGHINILHLWKYPINGAWEDPFSGTLTRTSQNRYRPNKQYNPNPNSDKPHFSEYISLKTHYATEYTQTDIIQQEKKTMPFALYGFNRKHVVLRTNRIYYPHSAISSVCTLNAILTSLSYNFLTGYSTGTHKMVRKPGDLPERFGLICYVKKSQLDRSFGAPLLPYISFCNFLVRFTKI